jgi:uncharacterized protein (TIGR02118 family)
MIRISVFYPYKPAAEFDFDYYINVHFPMVLELLKPYGALRFEVNKGIGDGANGSPSFIAIGHLIMESLDGFQKGMEAHAQQILSDVKNYTNLAPTLQVSEILQAG